jgi:hypothetical protein
MRGREDVRGLRLRGCSPVGPAAATVAATAAVAHLDTTKEDIDNEDYARGLGRVRAGE